MVKLMNIRYVGSVTNLLIGVALAISYPTVQAESRWYDDAILERGSSIFLENCASCHGNNAEGTLDWKKTDSKGNYPPPPLNGTAHACHHSIEVLHDTIRDGGVELGGVMPPFKDRLSYKDIDAAIAFFQSKWSNERYQKWAENYKVNKTYFVEPIDSNTDKIAFLSQNKMTSLLESRLGSNIFLSQLKHQ